MITEEQKEQIRTYFNSNAHIIEYEVFGEYPKNVQSIEELNNTLENNNLMYIRLYEITPYNNINELLEDSKIHGPYVIGINNHIYSLITTIKPPLIDGPDARIELGGHRHDTLSYKELSRLYTWQDGSVCGRLKLDFNIFND